MKEENKEINFLFKRENETKQIFNKKEELEFVMQMVSFLFSKIKKVYPSIEISFDDCLKITTNLQINVFNIHSNDNNSISLGFYPLHSFFNHR